MSAPAIFGHELSVEMPDATTASDWLLSLELRCGVAAAAERYYEGCSWFPLELKREFHQLDLTKEDAMNAPGAAQGKHTGETNQLYMAFELGEKNWKLALSDGARSPSHYTVTAGDTAALLECIAKAKARCELAQEASVHSCYEAGRDGFWLHRWLIAQGIAARGACLILAAPGLPPWLTGSRLDLRGEQSPGRPGIRGHGCRGLRLGGTGCR